MRSKPNPRTAKHIGRPDRSLTHNSQTASTKK